ncbi:hypothetical protein N9I68_02455 [Bacteroidia bacterium]|nr:hypothetical protein [Bacteroidia bacterium]
MFFICTLFTFSVVAQTCTYSLDLGTSWPTYFRDVGSNTGDKILENTTTVSDRIYTKSFDLWADNGTSVTSCVSS